MNRNAFIALAAVSLELFACTNQDDKPSQSPGAALDAVQNPTGSFGADNAGDAFSKYGSDKKSSSGLASTGGGSSAGGSTTTQSYRLHILAGNVQSTACEEGAKCACPSGGSFTYQKQNSDYGPALSASFDSCVFDDGNGFSGDMLLLQSDKPLLKSDKADVGTDAASDASLLLAADGTFTNGSDSIKADVVFLHERSVDYLAVEVKDGKIVIGVRETDGLAVVYAKDTTWVCKPDASANYDCQEQSSGQKVSASKPSS
ncbi:MAG TPA: hypothetical protein VIF62_28725 [Labilithrix sp.]